jgi:hypothetical protein
MSDTHNLLLALCDALGFEVEESEFDRDIHLKDEPGFQIGQHRAGYEYTLTKNVSARVLAMQERQRESAEDCRREIDAMRRLDNE